MKKQVVGGLFLSLVAVCCLAGASEAVKFRYENLGTLGGNKAYSGFDKEAGINGASQVAGKAYTSGDVLHAFVKSPGQLMVDLGGLVPGGPESIATCINSSGVVGGYYQDGTGSHACQWVPGGGGYSFQSLGAGNSEVHGMNDAGYLVGYDHANAVVKPPVGNPITLTALPTHVGGLAYGINSSLTIVGLSYDGAINTACFWSPSGGGYTAAATLFGVANSQGLAINNPGQAVGTAIISGNLRGVLKSPGKPLQELGPFPGGDLSAAFDINDAGWVVGVADSWAGIRAFLWTAAQGMQDLNNLVVNLPGGVTLLYAIAINQRGEIAGYTSNGVFKLTPIPEPPLSLLLFD